LLPLDTLCRKGPWHIYTVVIFMSSASSVVTNAGSLVHLHNCNWFLLSYRFGYRFNCPSSYPLRKTKEKTLLRGSKAWNNLIIL
jgi:hypothetical protein